MNLIRHLSAKLRLLNNRRRSAVSIEFRRGIPRLKVHEMHERKIKWTARILTLGGIAAAAIAFSPWYLGVIFAAALAATEQILERAIFRYTTLYVQPMPDFNYEPDEWLGMAFGEPADTNNFYIVAPTFRNESYARQFFKLIRSWNYDEDEDRNNNICISFIVEDPSKYSTYIYPSLERSSVTEFSHQVEREALLTRPGKEHFRIVVEIMFCKMFDYGPGSHFERFRRQQSPRPFWLVVAVQTDTGTRILWDAGPILKFHCKFKRRRDLSNEDMEYEHGKVIIGV